MISVNHGSKTIELDIPDQNLCFSIKRNTIELPKSQVEEVKRALQNPTGSKPLKDVVPKDASVVIMVDDRTRMTPQKLILPLYIGGIA